VPGTSLHRVLTLMPQPMRRKVSEQVLVQLIEAEVESGFGLVDEAKAYRAQGNSEFSSRALQEAEAVVADIEERLAKLGDSDAAAFLPLVVELREQIAAAGRQES
jgi:hypothetical protein